MRCRGMKNGSRTSPGHQAPLAVGDLAQTRGPMVSASCRPPSSLTTSLTCRKSEVSNAPRLHLSYAMRVISQPLMSDAWL